MLASNPLVRTFGGSRAAVLEVLLSVNRELSVRRIASLAKISPNTASAALQQLAEQNLLFRHEVSSTHTYKVVQGNFVIEGLKALLRNAEEIDQKAIDLLEKNLEGLPFDAGILFGSIARRDDRPDSDVDILVVGHDIDTEQWMSVIVEIEHKLGCLLGRSVHIIVSDWPSKTVQKTPFWQEIRRDGRPLVGQRVGELIDG